jgi:hypothetical protein
MYKALSKTNVFVPTPYQYEHEETNFNHHPILTSNFDPIGERLDKISVMDNGKNSSFIRTRYQDKIIHGKCWEIRSHKDGYLSLIH